MKILFLLSRYPYPLTKGDKLRAFMQMKHLAKENDVFLFCLNQKSFHKTQTTFCFDYLKGLKICNFTFINSCFGMLKSIFNHTPLQVGFYSHKRNIRAFEHYVKEIEPDIVYVQFVRMAAYCRNIKTKKVLDFQDALSANMRRRAEISNLFLKPALLREAKLLQRYEAAMLDFFDQTSIITDTDRQEIASNQRNNILIVSNGIDKSYFEYSEKQEKKYDVMFCGNMSYVPNVDAAKYLITKIMPLVWAAFPKAKVLIAGANPKRSVLRLASDNVKVSGYVEDMKQCYAESSVFVAALRTGSGLQNKLLEAMAIGTPVICSALANKALKAKANQHLLVANTTKEYADLIIKLLNDNALQQDLTSAAKTFVRDTYNWETICQNLSSAFSDLVSKS
ncbi:MAG: glycosyltransferase [Bacteroidales bacterium]|jgi:sugar transferase (PEP-CTERM/EpsH1 system associated)|nr:glycosyltransferase [Bacteroidales bacterium]